MKKAVAILMAAFTIATIGSFANITGTGSTDTALNTNVNSIDQNWLDRVETRHIVMDGVHQQHKSLYD